MKNVAMNAIVKNVTVKSAMTTAKMKNAVVVDMNTSKKKD
jgi:hypothetical protein